MPNLVVRKIVVEGGIKDRHSRPPIGTLEQHGVNRALSLSSQIKTLPETAQLAAAWTQQMIEKGLGVTYLVTLNGQPGEIKGRIGDLPRGILEHTLLPNDLVARSEHVRRGDLQEAARILLTTEDPNNPGEPVMLKRFTPIETETINWATRKFQLNRKWAMFWAETRQGEKWEEAHPNPERCIFPWGILPHQPGMPADDYAQRGFEGLKARRSVRDPRRIIGFRWLNNGVRFAQTAERLLLNPMDPHYFAAMCREVVLHNSHLVPPVEGDAEDASFYGRPVIEGNTPDIGVRPSPTTSVLMQGTDAGAYYGAGKITPITLRVEEFAVRAAPGGGGNVKYSGNYAISMQASIAAKKAGFGEALWQFRGKVKEAGTANLGILTSNGEIISPSREEHDILPGITVDSVFELAPHLGFRPVWRHVTTEELMTNPSFIGLLCFGTAAVITPATLVHFAGREREFQVGEEFHRLYRGLTSLQKERFDDPSLAQVPRSFLEMVQRDWINVVTENAEI